MLKKLIVRNFQIHRKLEIDFDPHITVVTGPTDSGKSAIIRALRWLALNKPSGLSFLRDGGKQVVIYLEVDDHTIQRRKGKGTNSFVLDDKKFCAPGQTIPDEIQKLLNLSEVNIQTQHEAPYWLSKSAGEVSRELNSIINLGLIDHTLAHLGHELRMTKTHVTVSQDRLRSARADRDGLGWVQGADRELGVVEGLHDTVQTTVQRLSRLRQITQQGKQTNDTLLFTQQILPLAEQVVEKGRIVKGLFERSIRLKKLEEQLTSLHSSLQKAQRLLTKAQEELVSIQSCPLCQSPLRGKHD